MEQKKEHWLFDREYFLGVKVALGGLVWIGLSIYLTEVKGVFSNVEEALVPCGLAVGAIAQIGYWIISAFKKK